MDRSRQRAGFATRNGFAVWAMTNERPVLPITLAEHLGRIGLLLAEAVCLGREGETDGPGRLSKTDKATLRRLADQVRAVRDAVTDALRRP